MKHTISLFWALCSIILFASCSLLFNSGSESSSRFVHLPENVRMKLDSDNNLKVNYHSVEMHGTIHFQGGIYDNQYNNIIHKYAPVFEKNLAVTVNWGTDKNNLNNSAVVTIKDPEFDYSIVNIPFRAKAEGLEDGAVYYFQAKVDYGNTISELSEIVKTFTLPEGPVDLDLKSGNLWHSCNLGADYPSESGHFYAWAETAPKKENALYDWTHYEWCAGSGSKLTKYCSSSNVGYNQFADNRTAILSDDDASSITLGYGWHTPSSLDWNELQEQCGWSQITINGVPGQLVRSKKNPDDNKKVIFLPCAGYMDGAQHRGKNWEGFYWSSTSKDGYYSNTAYIFYFQTGTFCRVSDSYKCVGESIRPVKSK